MYGCVVDGGLRGRTLDGWSRVLTIRMTACRARLEKRLAEAKVRVRHGGSYLAYFDVEDLVNPAIESIDSDLARLAAGELNELLAEPRSGLLPLRQGHCRSTACDRPRRRHIPVGQLRASSLTWPQNYCQRCGYEGDDGDRLELDHMAEMVVGGADALYNLVRLCGACHWMKPYPDHLADDVVEWRLQILEWVIAGPEGALS